MNERYQWSHFTNKNIRLLQLCGMFHGYYSSTCCYQVGRCTAGHSLAYKSQRKTMKGKEGGKKRKGEGKPEGNDRGKNKGGERATPALPTPSSAHHLLRPAATAILHHSRRALHNRKEKNRRGNETVRGENRNREGETIKTGGRRERKTQKNIEEPWGKKVTEEEGKKKENHCWSSSPPLPQRRH